MKNIFTYISIFLLTFSTDLFSQDEHKNVLAITAGAGVLTFNGDVGKGKDVSAYTYTRGGYNLNIEKLFVKNKLSASINILSGKLAMGERSTIVDRNNNFESSLTQFGLNLTAYLRNAKEIPVVPYFTTGVSFALLKTFADRGFNGDSLYYYWSDGSIRNLPQMPGNEILSHHVTRDYIYETAIDSAAKSTVSLPIGLGVKFIISPKLEANIGANYHFSFTDGIDALKGKGKDQYLYSYFSITYNIMKGGTKKTKEKSTIDFASIDNVDTDKDGVKDNFDACPGTPKGVKVDSKGCPLDVDDDGVPDYLDKEAGTKKGALVDTEGKTITDAMIKEKASNDSIAQGRYSTFMDAPSTQSLQNLDSDIQKNQATKGNAKKSKIPVAFQSADTNKDGIISSTEISAVIDGFFEGSNDYNVEKIHALIDYFFEQ